MTTLAEQIAAGEYPSQEASRRSIKKWHENHPPDAETAFRLATLLRAVVHLDLAHIEEATPSGYEQWDRVFEHGSQVTAWNAWKRDALAALEPFPAPPSGSRETEK